MPKRLSPLILTLILFVLLFPKQTIAAVKTDKNKFVRTASLFLEGGPVLDQHLEELARFDLIVIPVEAQVYNPSFFSRIRTLHPNIIILPYIATVSWNDLYWTDPLHQTMKPQIKPEWWLKDEKGNQVSVWPNTRALNLQTQWVSYLAQHVKNDVLSTGYWDGVFFDEVQDSISWVGSVDVNRDGKNDTAAQADTLWALNYQKLFKTTRSLIGAGPIIITNGSSNAAFLPYVNGRMFETFPSSHNTIAEWTHMVDQYLHLEKNVGYDPIQFINVNTDNTGHKGTKQDYQSVRFGLTTTLLGNGYFSYDESTYNHAVLWVYDEYQAYLGAPKSSVQNKDTSRKTTIGPGVWMREFEQGQVLVNATDKPQTIQLKGEFEKLHGTQDPKTNNGRIVSEVTLPSKDGLILLRPIEEILDASYLNGAFAKIYDIHGTAKRTGFFAYNHSQRGGNTIIQFDLNADTKRETIVADETFISIYKDTGDLYKKFAPYTPQYHNGITIAIGDLENDGRVEIVTGTKNGGGPQVRVFNQDGVLINPGFFAFDKAFRGGVSVAIGDLNGDAVQEIICGAGPGGGPHLRIFKKDGTLINPGFFAYEPSFRGGINVASADVDGDDIDDIVTGPGKGGLPIARIFDRNGKLKSEFSLFDSAKRDGFEVTVSDVDHDGTAEIIGLTSDVFTLSAF